MAQYQISLNEPFGIGALVVDPLGNSITHDNENIRVEPKLIEVLSVLAAHAGDVVTRDDILNAVWPNAVATSDESLTRVISELRRSMAIAPGGRNYIQTIPKRGYRLAAEVDLNPPGTGASEVPDPNSKPNPRAKPAVSDGKPEQLPNQFDTPSPTRDYPIRAIAASITFLALLGLVMFWTPFQETSRKADNQPLSTSEITDKSQASSFFDAQPNTSRAVTSLVVLPLKSNPSNPKADYLNESVAEQLINALSTSEEIRVLAHSSAFAFRDNRQNYEQMASVLDVTHVLDGEISSGPDGEHLTANLIDVSSGNSVFSWSAPLEYGEMEHSLTALQSAIVNFGTDRFSSHKTKEKRSANDGFRLASAEAYDHYLRGVAKQRAGGTENLRQARALFETSILLDPDYGPAHGRLAQTILSLGAEIGGVTVLDRTDARASATPHVSKALNLTPMGIDALEAQWRLQLSDGRCVDAEKTLETALARYPSHAPAHYSLYEARCCLGKWIAAYASAETAAMLDPFNDQYAMDHASTLILQDRYDDAHAIWRRVLDQHPEKSTGYRGLGHYNRFQGKLAAAKNWYDQALTIEPNLMWNRLYAARNLADLGLFEEAAALYPSSHQWELHAAKGEFPDALLLLAADGETPKAYSNYDEAAEVLAMLGRFDEAKTLLEAYADATTGLIGPLFADYPELDLPAPHLVFLRKRIGDDAGATELAERTRVFLDEYRENGGSDYLYDVIEARLAAALGNDKIAATWLESAVSRGFRIRRAQYFPEFVALGDNSALQPVLKRMDQLAAADRQALLAYNNAGVHGTIVARTPLTQRRE